MRSFKNSDKKCWGRICFHRVSALSICGPSEKEKPWKQDYFSFMSSKLFLTAQFCFAIK